MAATSLIYTTRARGVNVRKMNNKCQTGRPGFCFAIDRGGTFTDIYAKTPSGKEVVMKLLSEDPKSYPDAPREGIRRIMEEELGQTIPGDFPLDSSLIDWIRMGTTVATNALLERKGERVALLITEGFRDLLHIGNQSRPEIFDLRITCPETLYEEIVEVKERVVLSSKGCQLDWSDSQAVEGRNGEMLHVTQVLDKETLRKDLLALRAEGIASLAVVLMHSYIYPNHEKEVGLVAMEMGFKHVSLSSDVMPMVRIVPRGFTASADAYLTPFIRSYINSFSSGFTDPASLNVLFMQSDGGLTPMRQFIGSHAILSGPAGGVVGYAMTTYHHGTHKPVIGFDMGGTSTDVSRYAGEYEHVFESTTAGVTIQAPQLDINTVAAGGGSRLFFRSGMFVVGPESSGAHPGPTCYGKGGPLAITDANLVLGRLLPEHFPKIFGPNEDQPLDKKATLEAFDKLTEEVNHFLVEQGGGTLDRYQVAMGFIRVANETMCRPIRALTQGKGYDTSHHVLACFGGAGGQHTCAVARNLGMTTVFIHRHSSILSAYGLALADVVHEMQEPCAKSYTADNFPYLEERLAHLEKQCCNELVRQGYSRDSISVTPYLHLRYDRTDCALMCPPMSSDVDKGDTGCRQGNFEASFLQRYKREFGFTIPSRTIIVDDIRVRAVAMVIAHKQTPIPKSVSQPEVETEVECYFVDGFRTTSVYLLDKLLWGHSVSGPALIIDKNSTIVVEPHCTVTITEYGDLRMEVDRSEGRTIHHQGTELDAIQLSIFSHRFMSIAEQMGRVLQRTSISTNIKERLDFSCALFGPDGGLVANAPHIPVHLGAMQKAVQYQMEALGNDMHEGDVIMSNHPAAGGSHLPDITVITPVFYPGHTKPVFFVASRGHHADIGGITPGSMPPNSTHLWEEGMQVKTFKLVRDGLFCEEEVTQLLMEPAKLPGCSGTRNLHDNLSDLRAQVAANQKGISLVKELIASYGMEVVQAYMLYIQENAEVAVREMLKEIAAGMEPSGDNSAPCVVMSSEDFLDDGTPIRLKITIDGRQGGAEFDFTGTGPQSRWNLNAPRAITQSAILYCLRCMVGHDIPLNQGCLKPVKITIPPGCILDPLDGAAVIGGNVLTCQRVVDVVFRAFQVCAASQGCMNNTTFGDDSFGYYETVAGGAGAGPGWDGRSGVHTHMTNTRITDPEILERRYPVILKQFLLNSGSGGGGRWKGGDGVTRELLFRAPLTLCLLSERREYHPYGLKGGDPGAKGKNLVISKDGSVQNIGGKASVPMTPGDSFRLFTPGGGGYGCPGDEVQATPPAKRVRYPERGSIAQYKQQQESA